MKTAKEMFEELGFELNKQTKEFITYNKETERVNNYFTFIHSHRLIRVGGTSTIFIDLELHKAITQQMKELGWLDE